MSNRVLDRSFIWLSGPTLLRHRTVQIVYTSSLMMIMGTDLLYPVMPALLNPLGISAARVGLIISAFAAPGILLSPLIGALADLYGRKRIFSLGLFCYGSAGLAMAAAPSFSVILFLRALQGVAYIGVMPLVVVLLGDHFQEAEETSAQGFKVFFDRFGSFLFPALGGMLAAWSWRYPFLLYGFAVPVSVAAWLWLPESQPRRGIPLRQYIRSIARLVRWGRSLSIFGIGGLRFFLDIGFFAYLPLFLVQRMGSSTGQAGALFIFYSLGSMVMATQVGVLSTRFDKFGLSIAGFSLCALGLVLVPFSGSLWPIGVFLFIYGLGNGIISPCQKSLITQSAPAELRAGMVAADRIVQSIGKSVAPVFSSVILLTGNLQWIFASLGLIACAGASGLAFLKREGVLQPRATVVEVS